MFEPRSVNVDFELSEKFEGFYDPYRYKVAFGGRAGMKSWAFARMLVSLAAELPLRILCAREFQTSIKESVHYLLESQIEELGLENFFWIKKQEIETAAGGSFFFKGLWRNVHNIKSTEDIDIVWVEDAEKVSAESWRKLIPTIRKTGSEIWVSFNPDLDDDPTYKRFLKSKPPRMLITNVNSWDNPWLSDEMKEERAYDYEVDPEAAANTWGGECRQYSEAQIFKDKYETRSFEPGDDWDGPYQGADFGFSVSPTTLIRFWIYDRRLWIEYESYAHKLDTKDIPDRWKHDVPSCEYYTIRADNARPETISALAAGIPTENDPSGKSNRLIIEAAEKWPGSVEDGISWIRSFEKVIIHDRCVHCQQEARHYSYKQNLAGDVLPEVLKKHDHCWDGVRYGAAPLIKTIEPRELKVMA